MESISLKAERTEDYRCRVCLEFTEGMVCILDTVEIKQEALSYWDILLSICKLEIKNDNNIPQKICAICAQGAAASYEFKLLCENSDKILQSELICNTSRSIKADPDDFKFESTEEEINWTIATIKKSIIDQDKFSNENSLDTTENIHSDFADTTPEPFNAGHIVIENVRHISSSNTEINTLQSNQELQPHSFNPLENTDSTEEQDTTPDPNNYYCKNCGHKFVLEENLKLHMLMKICKKRTFPETCFACDYKPTSSIDFYRHRRMHRNKPSKRSCMYCDYAPNNNPDYQKHLLQFHSDKKIGCEYCSIRCFRPRVFMMHMKQEHPDKRVRCYICNFTTNVHQLYTKHVNEEHSDILQQRKCKFCDYSNVCPTALGKHMEFSHVDKKYVQCTKCERKFFNKKLLETHIKGQHEKKDTIMCEICGKHFKVEQNLIKHKTIHSGEKNFKCKSCNKRFRTSDGLHAHKQIHSTDRKYKCDKCSSQYKSASTLQRHVRIVHTKIKPRECMVCSKSFINSSCLKDHMITHTGIKNYECDTCGKVFGRKTHLVQHMVVHTGERRHFCEVCGKSFTQAHVLRTHLNTHKS